jgi:hypothetical protein
MKPCGTPKRRWEDNIRMDIRGTEWEGTICIHLIEDRDRWRVFVNTIMNLLVPYKAGNFSTI